MTFQIINTADPNFPVNLFTSEEDMEEDTAEIGDSNWIALSCCSYGTYPIAIDSIWEADLEE